MNNPNNIQILEGDWTFGETPFKRTEGIDQLDVPTVKRNMPPPISVYEDVRVITNESGIFVPETNKQEVLLENVLLELQKANARPQREIVFVKEQPVKTVVLADSAVQTKLTSGRQQVQNSFTIGKESMSRHGYVSESSLIPRSISAVNISM